MIYFYLKLPVNILGFILKDSFSFVLTQFGSIVKFQPSAQISVAFFSYYVCRVV